MNCREAMAALLATIESGTPLAEDVRDHLRSCGRCRELVDSAAALQTTLEDDVDAPAASVDEAAAVAEQEVGRTRIRMRLRIAGIVSLIAIPILSYIVTNVDLGRHPSGIAFEIGLFIAISFIAPVLIVRILVSRIRTPTGQRLYKRLGPHQRYVSGVCAGLAEATGINVTALRLVFIVLLFFRGLGLILYLGFDLAMQIHPDDRKYMRRFRMQRAWTALMARVRMQ